METDILKKVQLQNELNLLPSSKLDDVLKFIESLLSKSDIKKAEPRNLCGIWKNKGFEKVADLENEIKEIRHELSDSILNKKI
jgi:hypothetical protein